VAMDEMARATVELWGVDPGWAARGLHLCGFTPAEAERLVALKLRRERGELDDLTDETRRALFVRWLVEHGHLGEWPAPAAPEDGRRSGVRTDRCSVPGPTLSGHLRRHDSTKEADAAVVATAARWRYRCPKL
jgi:hypothetical protein